jgi:hypothetical protein
VTEGVKSTVLKLTHEYYYQVMGQMGIAVATWYDLFVLARGDYHVERVVFDEFVSVI